MPVGLPPQSGSGILGGVLSAVPIVGGIANSILQGIQNRKNRDFAREMYGMQRADAIADWRMQNEYNSPQAQMARLKAAGLNPNLVYGNGAVANNVGGVRGASASVPQGQAPSFDGSGNLMYGIDMAIKQQQLNNLRTSNAAMLSSISNRDADTTNKLFASGLNRDTRETLIATRESLLRNIGNRNELLSSQIGSNLFSLDFNRQAAGDRLDLIHWNSMNAVQLNSLRAAANARAESTNIADLKIKAEMVLKVAQDRATSSMQEKNLSEMTQHIRNAKTLQELDMWMRSAGFNWTDPLLVRELKAANAPFNEFQMKRYNK